MIIAIYFFIMNVALPQIGAYALALIQPIMVLFITFCGIVLLFGAVGVRISENLGATVVSGIFRAIGYICRTIIQAIGWIIRYIFRMIPRVFTGCRRTFNQLGMNAFVNILLSVIVTTVFVAIII